MLFMHFDGDGVFIAVMSNYEVDAHWAMFPWWCLITSPWCCLCLCSSSCVWWPGCRPWPRWGDRAQPGHAAHTRPRHFNLLRLAAVVVEDVVDVDVGPGPRAVVDALWPAPQRPAALFRPTQQQIDQSPSKLKILKNNRQSNLRNPKRHSEFWREVLVYLQYKTF